MIAEDLDRYNAPTIRTRPGYVLLEIDISEHETQAFLYDQTRRALVLENAYWAEQQTFLVNQVLSLISVSCVFHGVLRKRTLLMGVWHFGHLIGDHSHRFIEDAIHKVSKSGNEYSIHISAPNQDLNWLQDVFYSRCRSGFLSHSVYDYNVSRSVVRIFSLEDCYCYYPTRNKEMALSTASVHVSRLLNSYAPYVKHKRTKVLLTSERDSRIENITSLAQRLSDEGWNIVNPLKGDILTVLPIVRDADLLVCENGSIVFNCLLARLKPYYILASPRVKAITYGSAEWQGGATYNSYHDGLVTYLSCNCLTERHHPYSDKIFVDSESVDTILNLT